MSHVELKKRLLAAGWEQNGEWGAWSSAIECLKFHRTFRKEDFGIYAFRGTTPRSKKDASSLNRMGWKDLTENLRLPKEVAAVMEHCC
jgi:hypothetical protein